MKVILFLISSALVASCVARDGASLQHAPQCSTKAHDDNLSGIETFECMNQNKCFFY